jgi:hypothetical protein
MAPQYRPPLLGAEWIRACLLIAHGRHRSTSQTCEVSRDDHR